MVSTTAITLVNSTIMEGIPVSGQDLRTSLSMKLVFLDVSQHQAFALLSFSALVVHAIFNRWEPLRVAIVGPLLLLPPVILSTPLLPQYGATNGFVFGFVTFFVTLLTSIVLYRVSPFHPLSRYPGPFLSKITKARHVQKTLDGTQHLYIKRLHEQYGDIVRIGPNEVSLRDVSCVIPLLGSLGCPKGQMFEGRHFWPPTPGVIACRDPVMHKLRRRPWNRALNTAAIKERQPLIDHRVNQLVDALEDRQGQVVDLARWIGFFMYDLMGDLVYGGWTEMMKAGEDRDGFWGVMKRGLTVAHIYEHLPWLAYYAKYTPGLGGANKEMRAMCIAQTKRRIATGSIKKDIFYYLSNEDGSEQVTPPAHVIVSEGVLALVAGSDTTATVAASTMYCLLRHPAALERLRAEVDKYYPPRENSLDAKHYPDMHYLEAVIMEGLRMFPAVPSGSQRAPPCGSGGRVIGPYYIPEGTHARVHFYSLQRDARYFSNPEVFWPDRWLIAEGLQQHSEKINHDPNAWIPFSFGPSNCVGKGMALQELRTLLCHLVQRLDFRAPAGHDITQYERDLHDRFVATIGRLPVIFSKRE